MIAVACPNCSKRLKAPAEAIGKKAKCTGCGQSFILSAPPPTSMAEPAEIVLEPVDAPSRKRLPRWAILSLCCGGAAVLLLSVAALITRRYVAALSEVSVDSQAAAAEPSQKPPEPASPNALAQTSSAAPAGAPTTSPPRKPEEEYQRFATLPVGKAIDVYCKALVEESDAQSACEPLQEQVHREYVAKYESVFKDSVPQDLKDAFRRMADRSARRGRLIEILHMKEPERGAAVAKDAADDERIEKLRKRFENDLEHLRIPAVAKFVSSNSELARRLKEQETKLHLLQTKVDKFEGNLFPRLNRDQVAELRRFVHVDLRPEEHELEDRKKVIDNISDEATPKEIHSRTPPELEAAFRRDADPVVAQKRRDEIRAMPAAEQEAARSKDAEEDRKFQKIANGFGDDIQRKGIPLTTKFELDAKEALKRKFRQEDKVARIRARYEKLNALLGP